MTADAEHVYRREWPPLLHVQSSTGIGRVSDATGKAENHRSFVANHSALTDGIGTPTLTPTDSARTARFASPTGARTDISTARRYVIPIGQSVESPDF